MLFSLFFLMANYHLLMGLYSPIWDADSYYAPYYILLADFSRARKLLLWDPWSSGGTPAFINPQVGALSPLTIASGLLTGGSESGFRFYWLFIWWLGGLGIIALSRHLQSPPWGGVIAALGFTFSGFYTGHAEHTSLLYAMSFLPFIIWRMDGALVARRLFLSLEAGAFWGLSALGGYPGLVLIIGIFALLWAFGRWAFQGLKDFAILPHGENPEKGSERRLDFKFVAIAVALFFVAGTTVLSPVYVSFFYEGSGYTDRSNPLPREVAVKSNALHPAALATFASPLFPILQLRTRKWGYNDCSSMSVFVGSAIFVLALLSIFNNSRDKWRCWLLAMGLLAVACGMGAFLPFRGWLYDLLLPMRYFRHASIFRALYIFSVTVLAVHATRDFYLSQQKRDLTIWRRFFTVSAVTGISAVTVYLITMIWVEEGIERLVAYRSANLHLLWIWLGVLFISATLWKFMDRNRPALLGMMLIGLAGSDAFLNAYISHPIMCVPNRWWKEAERQHISSVNLTPKAFLRESGSLNNFNLVLKIPTLKSYVDSNNSFYSNMISSNTILAGMATGANRTWFSSTVALADVSSESYASWVSRTETLHKPVIVIHEPEALPSRKKTKNPAGQAEIISKLPPAISIEAKVMEYMPERLLFEVNCPEDGWLLITDRWSRSWIANINDIPTEVFGGNFIFRAIKIKKGINKVQFIYNPFWLFPLLIISWGTMLIITLAKIKF